MIEKQRVSDILFFQILEYLCIHNKVSWGWDPNPNAKFIYVSNTSHIQPESSFIQYFCAPEF